MYNFHLVIANTPPIIPVRTEIDLFKVCIRVMKFIKNNNKKKFIGNMKAEPLKKT
jgi:hypothetical protein